MVFTEALEKSTNRFVKQKSAGYSEYIDSSIISRWAKTTYDLFEYNTSAACSMS
jgi:hypothetical protein